MFIQETIHTRAFESKHPLKLSQICFLNNSFSALDTKLCQTRFDVVVSSRDKALWRDCDIISSNIPGRVAQSVTCLATDASLTADPGVASSIPARSHTFVEIDHEIISTALPLNHSRKVVVSYKRKYVHEVLVNCLFKLAQEKVWLGELTVPQ